MKAKQVISSRNLRIYVIHGVDPSTSFCTRVNQKFCNILVVRKSQFSKSECFYRGRENDEQHCEMPRSPDTLQELLTGFASLFRNTASE